MEGKENIYKQSHLYDGRRKSSLRCRKVNKPLVEKKRRARINRALSQLKALVLDSSRNEKTVFSKLEKADILEMTLTRLVQLQNSSNTDQNCQTVPSKYQAGFYECAVEAIRYLGEHVEEGNELKTKLVTHLATCIVGSNCTDDMAMQSITGDLKQINEETELIPEGMNKQNNVPDSVIRQWRDVDNICEMPNDHVDAERLMPVDVTSEHAHDGSTTNAHAGAGRTTNQWKEVESVEHDSCGTSITISDAENLLPDVTATNAFPNRWREDDTDLWDTNADNRTLGRVSSEHVLKPNVSNTSLQADENETLRAFSISENIPDQGQPQYYYARPNNHNGFVTEAPDSYPFRNVEENNAWLDAYRINSHNIDTADLCRRDGYQMENSLDVNSNVQCEPSHGRRAPLTSYLFEQTDRCRTNPHADSRCPRINTDRPCTNMNALMKKSSAINQQMYSGFEHGERETCLDMGLETTHGEESRGNHYSLFGQATTPVWRPW